MKPTQRQRTAQRGITLIGLLTWSIVLGFVGYMLVKVIPTVGEAYTIQAAIERLAVAPLNTVPEIRRAFDKQKEIDATIVSIRGDELDITKVNDKVVIGFAYEKEIPMFGQVFLLIKYAGRSK